MKWGKEELKDIYYLDSRIESKIRQLEQLNALKTCVGALDYSKDRIQTSTTNSTEDRLIRIIDLENNINSDIDDLIDMKNEARKIISKLSGVERTVLEMRYFEGMAWEEIAFRLGYEVRQIYRYHGKGLSDLQRCQ